MTRLLGFAAVAVALAPCVAQAQENGAGRWAQSAEPGERARPSADSSDTRDREYWLQTRILARMADGVLDNRAGRHALRELDDIRRIDADYRSADGQMTVDQQRDILRRLDALGNRLFAGREATGAGRTY